MAGKSVLLILDMQNELLDPQGKLYGQGFPREFDRLVPNVQSLLSTARAKGVAAIFVCTAYHSSFVDASPLSPSRKSGSLVEGSWGAEVVEQIAPRESEVVIRKRRPSGFYETPLDSVLRGLGAQSIFICGVATNRAVESTARDGFNRDYEVFIVSDGTAARSVAAHTASLESLGGFFGKVITAAEVEKVWEAGRKQ